MLVLVSYDVSTNDADGRRRLRKVAKLCEGVGQRVQKSVFECLLDPAQFADFRHKLESTINVETDSLRIYYLGKNWARKVEHIGAKPTYDPEGTLFI